MRIALFYHSLVSDWNHGNAHFLRGIARELQRLGHLVRVYEPAQSWSRQQLIEQHGEAAGHWYEEAYPELKSTRYELRTLQEAEVAAENDLILVHEWNDPALVARMGEAVAQQSEQSGTPPTLLFHDTHHRSVTKPREIEAYDLRHYDGVLAFGQVIRDLYLTNGWAAQAWTWHEAADTTVFKPPQSSRANRRAGDLVWVGNWGDDERVAELHEFLIEPITRLKLRATIHGVRFPDDAQRLLADRGIRYAGYLPNHRVPQVFEAHRMTVHVPRRPYAQALPGIPTIRPFEALACGIPLVSAPWDDAEGLFRVGEDFLMVRDGEQMTAALDRLMSDDALAMQLSRSGRDTITNRHTCRHRVNELLAIDRTIRESKFSRPSRRANAAVAVEARSS